MVTLTATGPEVFVSTMNTFLSYYYDYLEETLTHMNSLKLKNYPGEKITDCCEEILVDDERLESSGSFKPKHLGYITRIFEDTSNSRFRIWDIQKYKEITEFINKLCVCDMDTISQDDLIIYEYLVQQATHEYRNLVSSNRWEPDTRKEKSQDQPSLPKAYNVYIEKSSNKALKQVGLKIRRSVNISGSIGWLSIKSVVTSHI